MIQDNKQQKLSLSFSYYLPKFKQAENGLRDELLKHTLEQIVISLRNRVKKLIWLKDIQGKFVLGQAKDHLQDTEKKYKDLTA